jgi:hypothetical protein
MRPLSLPSLLLFAGALASQTPSRFATHVVQFTRGTGAGIFVPANALGHPRGAGLLQGSLHVLSLGEGGHVTLGFAVTITNGPGVDFIVSENPFLAGNLTSSFAEAVFVEASTDGVQFARFPTRFVGPGSSGGAFSFLPVGSLSGFAGALPVLANDLTAGGVDPFDPCTAGGDPFDLEALRNDPLVVRGAVDLGAIHYVRLVDVVSGVSRDSGGRLVHDATGGADIDAVAVIHHRGNLAPGGPRVAISLPGNGPLALRVSDPDGLPDLDESSLRAAINGIAIPFSALVSILSSVKVDAHGFDLATPFPLPSGLRFTFAASVRDRRGGFSADFRVVQ